jgi:uncharacterized cupredoxin-like copper-binding protein
MRQRPIRVAFFGLATAALVACGGGSSSDAGEPADASAAKRTVEVTITAAKRYQPAEITVAPGEVVTFKVTNAAAELHEFMVGDSEAHDKHEKLMAGMSMGSMKMADKPNYVDLDPGQTKQLTWKFPEKEGATVIMGSHVPGDYTGGLKGTITVGG